MTTPARQPADDDDAAQRYWLSVLHDRDGDADERITARDRLAAIYEHQGSYDAAAKLLMANMQDGVMNVEILERLSRLNRARGKRR